MDGEVSPRRVLCPWWAHPPASTLPAVARATAGRFMRDEWLVATHPQAFIRFPNPLQSISLTVTDSDLGLATGLLRIVPSCNSRRLTRVAFSMERACNCAGDATPMRMANWMYVDVNDPRCQRVLKKLEEADAAREKEAAFRRAQAEQRAATQERLRARRQAVKDAAASSSEGSRPPSPPPSPPSDPPPTAVDEETVRRLLADPAVCSRLHATVTGAMRAEGDQDQAQMETLRAPGDCQSTLLGHCTPQEKGPCHLEGRNRKVKIPRLQP